MSFEEFYIAHEHQFRAINLPSGLHSQLYLIFANDPSERNHSLEQNLEIKKWGNARPVLVAKEDIPANSICFMLEHIWTCDLKSMVSQLKKSPKLVDELAAIFNIAPPAETQSYFNDSLQISTIRSFSGETSLTDIEKIISKNNGDSIISAFGLSVDDKYVSEETGDKSKHKKECSFEGFVKAMQSTNSIPENANENYLRKMYENFLTRNEGAGTTVKYNWVDDDGMISVYVPIPIKAAKKSISSVLHSSTWKLKVDGKVVIDGDLYKSVKHDDSYWSIEAPGLLCMTLEKVDKDAVWSELIKGEALLSSDEIITKSWLKDTTEDIHLTEVLDATWKYNQTYAIASPQGGAKQPMWYIMDKYGSAFTHSNDANFKCSPFFYIKNNKAYSIVWPIKNIKKGELCTRNFIPQIMANETLDICKARMKAFLGKNISENAKIDDNVPLPQFCNNVALKLCNDGKAHNNAYSSIYNKVFQQSSIDNLITKMNNINLVDSAKNADISIMSLDDMVIYIDQDLLPAKEMLSNKDYLSSYLKYHGLQHDSLYVGNKYILPQDLVDFNNEFEQSYLPTYWIIKPVSKEIVNIPACVTSQYSRISRLCEAGSISVSQYVSDQMLFRDFQFTMSYTLIIMPDRTLYIYKIPFFRTAEEKMNPSDIIHEYDPKPLISVKSNIQNQQIDWYDELKIGINKKILPHTPDFKWDDLEQKIYKQVGVFGKRIAKDIHFDSTKVNVLFSVDVLLSSDLKVFVTDIDGTCNLSNEQCSSDIITLLTKGTLNSNFIMVL